MSTLTQPTDERFLTTAIDHRFIAEAQAAQLRADLDQSLEPVSELVISRGILDRTEVECIRALANPRRYAPGFEIMDVIGKGGMGVVFFARQVQLDRFVALKTVYRANYETLDGLKRFRREASVIGTLRHPNIVTAYEVCEAGGRVFLAMEFVDGIDLEQWIELNGPLTVPQTWSVLRKICVGLRHAARHGVIHRDIKPSNVLLAECPDEIADPNDGLDVKIADFGLAIRNDPNGNDDRLTSAFTTLGSPHYMAPEQFDHALVDLRCDIYGVGATAYHLLAGHPPLHELQTAQIVAHKIRHQEIDLEGSLSHVDERSKQLLRAMLAPRAEHRIQDYDLLLQRLDQLIAENGCHDSRLGNIAHRLPSLRQDSLPEPTVRLASPSVETDPIQIDTSSFRRRSIRGHLAGMTVALAVPFAGLLAVFGIIPGVELDSLFNLDLAGESSIANATESSLPVPTNHADSDSDATEPSRLSEGESSDTKKQIVSRALIPFPPTLADSADESPWSKSAGEEAPPAAEERKDAEDLPDRRARPDRIPRADELVVLPPGHAFGPGQDLAGQGQRDLRDQAAQQQPVHVPPPHQNPLFGPPPRRGGPRGRGPNNGPLRHVNHR